MFIKSKQSKRYSLIKLAPDWREKIFESIKSPKLKAAVAVLSATGCRPSELERGVAVKIVDGKLMIGIQGSKVDLEKGRGQSLRMISVATDSPWGSWLTNLILNSGGATQTVTYDAAGVSQRLREKSKELWPRRKTLVSAYCYRHYIGKSLKESGAPREKIAQTLGHATDHSQTAYGKAGGGKKTAHEHGIVDVRTSNPVRHSPKTDKLAKLVTSRKIVLAG